MFILDYTGSTKNNAHHFGARYFLYNTEGSRTREGHGERKRFGEPFLAVSGETGTEMQSISVGEPC